MVVDSGTRREFDTGAVRDIQEGKGRCDLLPLDVVAALFSVYGDVEMSQVLYHIYAFLQWGSTTELLAAINYFAINKQISLSDAMLEVSIHYEDGCKKYGEHNWEKGIPLHSFIDSGVRHLLKFTRGDSDERHDRAFIWNMLGAVWTVDHKPDMVDIPAVYSRLTQPDKAE